MPWRTSASPGTPPPAGRVTSRSPAPPPAGDLPSDASGQPKPNVSNLNYNTGLNVANSVTVKLSGGGAVDIYSNVGSCNVILDVAGYIV